MNSFKRSMFSTGVFYLIKLMYQNMLEKYKEPNSLFISSIL